MGTELSDIDRALLVFRNRVENVLIGEGAYLLPDGAFLLHTLVGPLRVVIDGNWIIGHFGSPLGGSLATKRGSDPRTGKWLHYCPQKVRDLCDPRRIEDFAIELDVVLGYKVSSSNRLLIEQDLRDRRRDVARLAVMFAATPDPDAPKREGATPPLGTLITAGVDPAKPGSKAKTVKAPKPKAAKDAKPKRRGRVAKRKVS